MSLVAKTRVKRNAYFDSVVLMRIAAGLTARPEVDDASLMMGTPANKDILREAGLLDDAGSSAGPNDLVIAVRSEDNLVDGLLAEAETGLTALPAPTSAGEHGARRPRALAQVAGANLALISTPGAYAAAEALKALKLGMHVFLFSDNVPVEDEVMLKGGAWHRGLLVMGAECGAEGHGAGSPLGKAGRCQLHRLEARADRAERAPRHHVGGGRRDRMRPVTRSHHARRARTAGRDKGRRRPDRYPGDLLRRHLRLRGEPAAGRRQDVDRPLGERPSDRVPTRPPRARPRRGPVHRRPAPPDDRPDPEGRVRARGDP